MTALVVPAGAALQMVLLPPPADSRMAAPVQWTVWITAVLAVALIVVRPSPVRGVSGSSRPG